MSVLAPILRSLENPSTSLSNADEWLYDALGAGRNSSGERVNATTALHYSPIWRGLNLICTTLAKTPIHLYRRKKQGGSEKERATGDPRYRCLRYCPCSEYTDYRWKYTMYWRALLRGNSIAYIFDKGRPSQEYVPLDPNETYIFREGTQLFYMTKAGDRDVRLLPDEVIHFTGWGDGPIGLSLVQYAAECIGLGLAQQKHASIFYKNGMKPSVVLEYPKIIEDKQYAQLLERYRQAHSGAAQMEKPLLLQNGMTAKPWVVSGRDAQFLEQRKFGIREAANFLNLPAYKLGDDARTSFASLEQSNQEFIDESIDPHMAMAEAEFREKLLTDDEKEDDALIVEFHRQSLMRTDFASRQAGYRTALAGRPYLVPDEVRAMENMPPLPEGVGSTYLDPLNMGNLGGDPEDEPMKSPAPQMKPAKPSASTTDDEDDRALRAATLRLVVQSAERLKSRVQKHGSRKGTTAAIATAVRDEVRAVVTPYCLIQGVDIDGATARLDALLYEECELTSELLAGHLAGRQEVSHGT